MGRIFVTGDCHRQLDIQKIKDFKNQEKNLTKEDYLIVMGDFGAIWTGDYRDKEIIDWWDNCPWTTLFIDGNHENHTLLNQYPVVEFCQGQAHKIGFSVYHLMRGQIFILNSYKFLIFGGANSIDWFIRTENISWWKNELPTSAEVTMAFEECKKYNYEVDFILCHACPTYIRTEIWQPHFTLYTEEDIRSIYGPTYWSIEKALDEIIKRVRYKRIYFGHYHIDKQVKNARCLYNTIYEIVNLQEEKRII